MKKLTLIVGAVTLAAGIFAGCQSSIVPLGPIQRIETWEPLDSADTAPGASTAESRIAMTSPDSQPDTQAATQKDAVANSQSASQPTTLASSQASSQPGTQPTTQVATIGPATRPGKLVVKIIDPNQSARFVYRANYDRVWQQSLLLMAHTGFALDRQDYRLGLLTTQPLPSAQIIEPWKPQQTDANSAWENTINDQRRIIRITIAKVPKKPEFYEIAIQVLVEREVNPTESLGGFLFTEGSGFGRNKATLRSDYGTGETQPIFWIKIGHDPKLEKKLLDALFDKI